jgi:hypothetical protein
MVRTALTPPSRSRRSMGEGSKRRDLELQSNFDASFFYPDYKRPKWPLAPPLLELGEAGYPLAGGGGGL